MIVRHNFRLYPTPEQEQHLLQEVGNQRWVWNAALIANREQYELDKRFIFYSAMTRRINEAKETHEWLKIGCSQALQQTLRDFDDALKRSFKSATNQSGFPRFKRGGSGGSVRFTQAVFIRDNRLKVPKLDTTIRVRWDGQGIPDKFGSVTVKRVASGKWYVSFIVEVPDVPKVELSPTCSCVGIDLNADYVMVLSNGQAVKNPRHLLEREARLKRYQRKMSRQEVGSKNRAKTRVKLTRLHEQVANTRRDFIHKLTTDIAKQYDFIAIEDLNVRAMQQFNGRMIQNAPFGMMRQQLTWKANKFGKHLAVISRWAPTSKVCSECGQIHEMPLDKRWLKCDCGSELHRDHNAAINILRAGMNTAGLAEINACGDDKVHDSVRVRWSSLKQETMAALPE